jgi:hypothetical protein
MTKKPPDQRLTDIAKTMAVIMELSGLSRREIARRLGGDYGVRRILDGSPELRVRQLLSFADAVGMKPIEILRIALADDGTPSPMALRLQETSSLLAGLAQRLQVTVAPAVPAVPPAAAAGVAAVGAGAGAAVVGGPAAAVTAGAAPAAPAAAAPAAGPAPLPGAAAPAPPRAAVTPPRRRRLSGRRSG